MLRIAICDDEFYFINEFSKLVKDRFENIEIVDKFTNPKELLNSNILYDVIFLDIDMPEIDGIEVAKAYDKKDTLIVFVTNKEALVFDAYNSTNSFGFIRKSKMNSDSQSVFNRLKTEYQRKGFLTLKNNSGTMKVKYSDIMYVEKVVNNVMIHTKRKVYSMRSTITEVEQMLKDSNFVRSHIGYIVNLDYINLITTKDIVLINSETIPLSRKNIKHVKEEFIKRMVMLSE